MASDRPDEPAQMSPDLGALGPLGRPQHGRDEASLTVEHDHGLEAVFVIVGIEQAQLLIAVNGIEGIVDVEHDLLGSLSERGAVQLDQGPSHAHQTASIGHVLQARECRLRGEIAIGWEDVLRHLEDRVRAQADGIVAILLSRGNHQQAEADQIGQAMNDLILRSRIIDARGEPLRHPEMLVHFAQGKNSGVGGQQAAVEPRQNGLACNR